MPLNHSAEWLGGNATDYYPLAALAGQNSAPVVFNDSIALNSSVTLTEGGQTAYTVKFNVSNGAGTSGITNVGVNITFNGIKRSNNTGNCQNLGDSSPTTRAYSCIVAFNYYDNASSIWDINITATNNAGVVSSNSSATGGAGFNMTINSLSAFSIVQDSNAASTSLGTNNVELPFIINNTGNFDFTLINVTPFDLNASLTDFFKLEGNFTINATKSAAGFGDAILNGTPRNFTESNNQISAVLPHKITGDADNLGNRTLYIYVNVPLSKGLSTGVTYNISRAWELFAS
jgi:hypothetical protein